MKKTISAVLSFFALACAALSAQTFNPRVEVENTYEGKVVEAGKSAIPMNVPDSLYKFQYQLDYSVFDNPYKGSYNFQPYKIEMKPDAVPSAARRFYFNLGAGWTLHPELDLVWSPVFRTAPARLTLYDHFRGYWGPYGHMGMEGMTGGIRVLNKNVRSSQGFVLDNKTGANLRYEFAKVALEVDGGFRIFATDDTLTSHFLRAVESEVRLLPLDPNKADYFYGGRVYIHAGQDRFSSLMTGRHKLGVNDMGADLRFGAPLGARSRVLVDFGIASSVYSGAREAVVTKAWVTPHYQVRWMSGSADLGVSLSYLKGSDSTPDKRSDTFQHKSDFIYPAVKVKQYLIPDHLAVYAKAVGGDELNSYQEYLRSNPFFNPAKLLPFMDSSSERVNASAGFEGDIAGRLQFDVHAGYAIYHNGRCDAADFLYYQDSANGWNTIYLTSYNNFCDYNKLYVDLSFLWKSPRLDMDGHFLYQDTDLYKNQCFAIAPSRLSGEWTATYNWNRQAFAGVSVAAASKREGYAIVGEDLDSFIRVEVPGWVDLGLTGRYVINPRWTVWAKAGNLLGQRVQRYFLHPEIGPYGTVGITFNF